MPWKRFWKRSDPQPEPDTTSRKQSGSAATGSAAGRKLPAHLSKTLEERTWRPDISGPVSDPVLRQLATMKKQRLAILYDIEQGELAASKDNPWTGRIELLTQAIETVNDDLRALRAISPGPFFPVPATPVEIGAVKAGDTPTVAFTIGTESFLYSEEPDWAERGHQMIRTELIRRSGDPSRLVPGDTPPELRDKLRDHLADGLFVFASDLRDRALDGESLPRGATLANMATPCPRCSRWTDWSGTCQACATRAAEETALKREQTRLLDERAGEAEEQHRRAERLPLARRRLHDIDTRIATLSSG